MAMADTGIGVSRQGGTDEPSPPTFQELIFLDAFVIVGKSPDQENDLGQNDLGQGDYINAVTLR